MKYLGFLVLALAFFSPTSPKKYRRCELARELLNKHKLPKSQIATWVCIARQESNYNTKAFNNETKEFGIFQISSIYWCNKEEGETDKACGISCSSLIDNDLKDDVDCAKKIFKQHQESEGDGFKAWVMYSKCKNPEKYVFGCFI